jgi:DoxX-like family
VAPGRYDPRVVVVWVLTVVLAVVFLISAGMKLLAVPYSVRNRDRFGLSPSLWRTIGVLELAGVAGLFVGAAVPLLGAAAGIGLGLLMVGAAATRVRARDPLVLVLADVVVLALVVWYIVVRL